MFSGELALQADSRPNRPQRQVPSTTRTCNLQLLTRNALLAFPTERLWRVDAQTAERRTPCAPRHVIHPHKRKQTREAKIHQQPETAHHLLRLWNVPPKGQFAQSTGRPCRVQRGQSEPHRMPLCLADGRAPLLEPLPEVLICGPTELPHAPYSAYGGRW